MWEAILGILRDGLRQFSRWRVDDLEEEILRAARENGDEIAMIETEQIRGVILIADAWRTEDSPAATVAAGRAFDSLKEKGFVVHVEDRLWRLTPAGRKRARRL